MTTAELDRYSLLHKETRHRVGLVIEGLKRRGYDAFLGATRRSPAEVEAARLAGRSSAKQTRSWHELGRAADIRPRKAAGGPNYDTGPASYAFWHALQEEAETAGMRCLAYRLSGEKLLLETVNGKRWDPGHIEYRFPYNTLAEAIKKEGTS